MAITVLSEIEIWKEWIVGKDKRIVIVMFWHQFRSLSRCR